MPRALHAHRKASRDGPRTHTAILLPERRPPLALEPRRGAASPAGQRLAMATADPGGCTAPTSTVASRAGSGPERAVGAAGLSSGRRGWERVPATVEKRGPYTVARAPSVQAKLRAWGGSWEVPGDKGTGKTRLTGPFAFQRSTGTWPRQCCGGKACWAPCRAAPTLRGKGLFGLHLRGRPHPQAVFGFGVTAASGAPLMAPSGLLWKMKEA